MRSAVLLALVVSVSAQSDTPCWDEVDFLQSTGQADRPGAPSYRCDGSGKYEPVQCTGAKCHCVEPDGTRQQGYRQFGIHLSGQYKCACARKLFEINESGRDGPLAFCDSYGNYEPVQCTGAECYCVTPQGAKQQEYKAFGIHLSGEYKCECARGFYNAIEAGEDGYVTEGGDIITCDEYGNIAGVLGSGPVPRPNSRKRRQTGGRIDTPPIPDTPCTPGEFSRCDSEGNYEPLQCTETECYCIAPDGRSHINPATGQGYTPFSVTKPSYFGCACARKRYELQQSGRTGVTYPTCDSFGSYLHQSEFEHFEKGRFHGAHGD